MEDQVTTTFKELPVAQVKADPNNPRKGKLEIGDLLKSVKEIGLIEPIVVRKVGDSYVVVAGHRRLATIRELKWPTIGAVIVDGYDDAGALRDAVAENTVRQPLSATDEMSAMVQLAGLGMTDAEIAEAFARDIKTVEAAMSIENATEKGAKALAHAKPAEGVQLTIEQSAAIARFGGTSAGKQMVSEIEGGSRYWRSTYEKLVRKEKIEDAAKLITSEHKGVKKTGAFPGNWEGPPKEIEPLVNLTDAKGKQVTTALHKTCPGHAYSIQKPDQWGGGTKCIVTYWCTDWKANGHKIAAKPKRKWDRRGKEQPTRQGGSGMKKAVVTDEVIAAERAMDTQWFEAATRRKDFTTEFIAKAKTGDKWISFAIQAAMDWNLRTELADINDKWRELNVKELVKAVVGAYIIDREFDIGDWRWQEWNRDRHIKYLRFLVENGHELSEVEKIAIERAEAGTPFHTRMEYKAEVVDEDEWDDEDDDVDDDEVVDVVDSEERV